jgi:hypothetical protein
MHDKKPLSNLLRAKKVRIKILSNTEILKAKILLYDIYVIEMGWMPSQDNPSKWKIADSSEGKILIDDYDSVATWIGAISSNDEIVGCVRLCSRHQLANKLELENYTNQVPNYILNIQNMFELTRGAVHYCYRYRGLIFLKMFKKVFEILQDINGSALATSSIISSQKLVQKTLAEDLKIEFKYEDRDQNPAKMYLYDYNNMRKYIESVTSNINEIESNIIKYESKLLLQVQYYHPIHHL